MRTPKRRHPWPLNTILEVTWVDSHTLHGWGDPKGTKPQTHIGPCRSVGYLLQRDQTRLTLMQSMSAGNGDVSEAITIPVVAVTHVRRLR